MGARILCEWLVWKWLHAGVAYLRDYYFFIRHSVTDSIMMYFKCTINYAIWFFILVYRVLFRLVFKAINFCK